MKQTHGFKGVEVTEQRVRVSLSMRNTKVVARSAASAQMGYPCILTRVIEQEAGKWMEWEYVPA